MCLGNFLWYNITEGSLNFLLEKISRMKRKEKTHGRNKEK